MIALCVHRFFFLSHLKISYICHVPFETANICLFPKNRTSISFSKWWPDTYIWDHVTSWKEGCYFVNSVKSPLFFQMWFYNVHVQTLKGDGELSGFPSFSESLWMMPWIDLVFQLSFTFKFCTNTSCTPTLSDTAQCWGVKVSRLRQRSCLQGAPSLSKRQTEVRELHKSGVINHKPGTSKNNFYVFDGWKRIKRRMTFHDMKKLNAVQTSVSTNKILLEHSPAKHL